MKREGLGRDPALAVGESKREHGRSFGKEKRDRLRGDLLSEGDRVFVA